MKRPKLKKASKRVSCSKRYKIEKKVREHHKKLRKDAKKKGVTKRVKKDPGVPSIAPFKEEVLREAEQRRLKLEAEKEKKKQEKKEGRANKRKKEKDAASKEAGPEVKRARTDKAEKLSAKRAALNLNRSSKPCLCSELNKVINESSVILEVLDARDPLGSRCPQLEEAVLQRQDKKLLFVLTKIDLVPKENVERWIQYLQQEFPVVAFKASAQIVNKAVQQKKRKKRITASLEVPDMSRAAASFGNTCLLRLLESRLATTQSEGALKVGVVGFPNVGKSSLINTVKGLRVCGVGLKRGMTKSMQDVSVLKNLKLLDSPGIVASPSNPPASLALRSLRVEEGEENVLEAVRTLLKQCDSTQIMLQYNVPNFRNSLEFLTLFAKKRSYLLKGGQANVEKAATTVLDEWTGAKLSYHSKVPETPGLPSDLTDAAVAEMREGWNLQILKTGNQETLKGVKFPNKASSMAFISQGPTAGLLSVTAAPEEKPAPAALETQKLEDINEDLEQKPKNKQSRVQFRTVPVDISISTLPTDDAYDFNTDFK